MANQIAANVSTHDPDEAARLVAAHLHNFWAPQMRERLQQIAIEEPELLSPLVHAALPRLRSLV